MHKSGFRVGRKKEEKDKQGPEQKNTVYYIGFVDQIIRTELLTAVKSTTGFKILRHRGLRLCLSFFFRNANFSACSHKTH